jgi:hypothetical protein
LVTPALQFGQITFEVLFPHAARENNIIIAISNANNFFIFFFLLNIKKCVPLRDAPKNASLNVATHSA